MKKIFIVLGVLSIVAISAVAQKKITVQKPLTSATANGKNVYVKYCLSCHQADGGGVQNMNPSLIHASYVLDDKTNVIALVLKGRNTHEPIDGQTYTNVMPSFSYLKDQDVADVLTYVRSHFTNKAVSIKAKEVTQVRAGISTNK